MSGNTSGGLIGKVHLRGLGDALAPGRFQCGASDAALTPDGRVVVVLFRCYDFASGDGFASLRTVRADSLRVPGATVHVSPLMDLVDGPIGNMEGVHAFASGGGGGNDGAVGVLMVATTTCRRQRFTKSSSSSARAALPTNPSRRAPPPPPPRCWATWNAAAVTVRRCRRRCASVQGRAVGRGEAGREGRGVNRLVRRGNRARRDRVDRRTAAVGGGRAARAIGTSLLLPR